MSAATLGFDVDGYVILDDLLSDHEVRSVESQISNLSMPGAGTRNLLQTPWCREIAERLKENRNLAGLLPPDPVAVQCTYFEKTLSDNWLVALHRDLFIPVKHRVPAVEWFGWSEKEGQIFAQPPRTVLESLVAVRVHLEDNTESNSPLKVVPGSHRIDGPEAEKVTCIIRRGGALVMRPLLLHGSSKLKEGSRRVLHFLFGPKTLPNQAEWA